MVAAVRGAASRDRQRGGRALDIPKAPFARLVKQMAEPRMEGVKFQVRSEEGIQMCSIPFGREIIFFSL